MTPVALVVSALWMGGQEEPGDSEEGVTVHGQQRGCWRTEPEAVGTVGWLFITWSQLGQLLSPAFTVLDSALNLPERIH